MVDKDLIAALRRLKVETGSIACLGCGYEHNCSVHGCHIMRVAAKRLEQLTGAVGRQEVKEIKIFCSCGCNLDEPKMTPQEAIGRIRDHMAVHHIGKYPHVKLAEALEMAIKALMNMEKRTR